MTIEQVAALLKAVGELLGVLVWPAVAVFVLVRFGPALREFFGSLGELTFKAAGIEATAKRQQAAVAAALGAAIATSHTPEDAVHGNAADRARDVADVVVARVNPRTVRQTTGSRILWVDDRPMNQRFERRSLEALGITFDTVLSTDDALAKLALNGYDVVISDMGRPPDARAGYTLLDAMRQRGIRTPFIIYTASNTPEHAAEARTRGAVGITNKADELFNLVLNALAGDGAGSRASNDR
jgi:CheY-like chemotaxis protein